MAESRKNEGSGTASELGLPPEVEDLAGLVQANEVPPDLEQPLTVLKYLFGVEMARIGDARRCEAEHGIVFPETSIIVHDIMKLLAKITELRATEVEPVEQPASVVAAPTASSDDGELSKLIAELNG